MRWFKTKEEEELDALLVKVDNNMSNNYKDAAQGNYKDFLKRYAELDSQGKLSAKVKAYYEPVIADYAARLSKFTHKDQPTKWGDWEKK